MTINRSALMESLKFTGVVFLLIPLIGGISLIKLFAICCIHFLLTQFAFKIEDEKGSK